MNDDFGTVYKAVETGFRRKILKPTTGHFSETRIDRGTPESVKEGFDRALNIFEGPGYLNEEQKAWVALGLMFYYLEDSISYPSGAVDGFALAAFEMDQEDETTAELTEKYKLIEAIPCRIKELSERFQTEHKLSDELSEWMARGYVYGVAYRALRRIDEIKESEERPYMKVEPDTKRRSLNLALRSI